MTDEELNEIEQRANAATDLPENQTRRNRYDHGGGRMYVESNGGRDLIVDVYNECDREFYFHARTDIPKLIAALRECRRG